MATVKLYYFEGYDFHEDRVVRSRRPATPEFIARHGLHRVEDNAVEVDSSQVDAEGMLAGDS
jgi:hypothetical protein